MLKSTVLAATLLVSACGRAPEPPPEPPRDTSWKFVDDSWEIATIGAPSVEKDYPDLRISCDSFDEGKTIDVTIAVYLQGVGASTVGSTDFAVIKFAGFTKRIVIGDVEIEPERVYDDYSYSGIDLSVVDAAIEGAAPGSSIEFKRASQRIWSPDYPFANLQTIWPEFVERCHNPPPKE